LNVGVVSSSYNFGELKSAQHRVHWTLGMPSAHALGLGDVHLKLTRPICLTSIFLASSFFCSQTESTPAHTQVTQAVETVEKVGKFNNYCKAMGFYKPEEPNGKIQTL
jgi:hypothetical protein